MGTLYSQDAEFLFSTLPVLFLVSLLAALVGIAWISTRKTRHKGAHLSGLPETASNAGVNRDKGEHESAPPSSPPLQQRLEVLETFLDENPPDKEENKQDEKPPSTQATPPSETDSIADSDSDKPQDKDSQLKNVVRSLKDQAA